MKETAAGKIVKNCEPLRPLRPLRLIFLPGRREGGKFYFVRVPLFDLPADLLKLTAQSSQLGARSS